MSGPGSSEADENAGISASDGFSELPVSFPGFVQRISLTADGAFEVPYWGPNVIRIVGMEAEERLPRNDPVLPNVLEEDGARLRETLRSSAHNHSVWRCEYRVRHFDGSIHWLEGTGAPLRLSDGTMTWTTIHMDIDERKSTEEALSRRHHMFLGAFRAASVCFWILDEDGCVVEANQVARRTFSHRIGEPLWSQDAWSIEPDDVELMKAAVKGAKHQEQTSLQFKLRSQTEPTAMWISCCLLRPFSEERPMMMVEGWDVTPEERRERFVRSLELSAQVAEIGGFTYIHDDKTVELSSQAAAVLNIDLGGDVAIEQFLDMFDPADRSKVSEGFQRVFEGSRREWEFEARLGNDTRRPRFMRLWLYRDELSISQHRLYGVIQDVTQQRVERETAQHAQRLESLGRLAGGVAHDFNNLLTTILGSGELLKGEHELSVIDELVDEILLAAERGRAMTQRLLTVARRQEGHRRRTDIGGLIAESAPLWRRMLGERVKMDISVEPGPITVVVDPRQFDQVLMNLLINARDAMPDGGNVKIELRSSESAPAHLPSQGENERWCQVTVQDNGQGMAPEAVERAFEPFFTTKGPGKGTGLGLATSYAIIRQSGGALDLESQPERGTTVRIWLPCTDQDPTGDLPPTATTPTSLRRRTIMVLEDDLGVGQTMMRMLERMAFRVVLVHTAEEAISAASVTPIDLLVSDVVMPEISGPAVASRLKEKNPELRVLFVSGYPGTELERHGWDPETPLLHKPFTAEELFDVVTKVL
ncbi:MAG: ATP-binding protein [Myxococcota bacterium]